MPADPTREQAEALADSTARRWWRNENGEEPEAYERGEATP